jgi:hypothetical protein
MSSRAAGALMAASIGLQDQDSASPIDEHLNQPPDPPKDAAPQQRRDEADLAEYRAYLQRGETRLSTLHRVAGAFISGAGLLTLLPLLIGGTFSGLLVLVMFYEAPGLPSAASPQRWLLLANVLASITLPIAALYLLIRDLILFYFTARSFRRDNKSRTYPRFVLSGIMVSEPSLQHSAEELHNAREDEYVRNLLVPSPARLRARILKEAKSVGDLKAYSMNDDEEMLAAQLREFVLRQTASHIRSLPEESAKMEASIARHQRFLRGLVLRYAKAFLLTIITTVSTIAADGVLGLLRPFDGKPLEGVNPQYVWLMTLAVYGAWALTAVVVVRKPVTWLYADTSDTKSRRTPQSLLNFERSTLAVGAVSSILVTSDALIYANRMSTTSGIAWLMLAGIIAMAISTLAFVVGALMSELPAARS